MSNDQLGRGDDDAHEMVLPSKVLASVTLARRRAALDHPALVGGGEDGTPLVLVGTRLDLRRYWQYERNVCREVGERLAAARGRALRGTRFFSGASIL